jgi:choice-of-anchor C domain-containing protein
MRAFLVSAAFVGALLGAASQASAASVITDGDFTSPSGGGSYVTYNGGTMGPWDVSGSVDLIGGYWQAPTAGGGSVDLDGNSPGGVAQTFSAAPGDYELTFFLSGNPDGGDGVKTVDVSVGGADKVFTFTNTGATNRSDMGYVEETLKFFNSGTSTLSFTSKDVGTPYGPVIGGVSVSAVPEPAVWAMMLVGFGGLGVSLRSSRRRATLAA